MGEETGISWTDATWNPWVGCTKVSEGCHMCYMYRDMERYGRNPTVVVKTSDKTFQSPLKWKKPKRVFVCSWSDFFHKDADIWRNDAWCVIHNTPQHTYQILTKRPERIKDHLPDNWCDGYENVWLGTSVENQKRADERIPYLLDIPAVVRFLSCEPLLSNIDLTKYFGYNPFEPIHFLLAKIAKKKISWVIVGGESGNEIGRYRYRTCNLNYIESIVSQCRENGVPVFVKQLGSGLARKMKIRDSKGGNIDEFPEHLRVREFPI